MEIEEKSVLNTKFLKTMKFIQKAICCMIDYGCHSKALYLIQSIPYAGVFKQAFSSLFLLGTAVKGMHNSLIYCLIDQHGSPVIKTLVTNHCSRLYYSLQCSGHNELETKIFSRFASEIGNGDVPKACMPSCQVTLLGKQLAAWSAVVNRLHKGSAVED